MILGDMLELGSYGIEEHKKILDWIVNKFDPLQVVLIGPIFYGLKNDYNFTFYKNIEDAKSNIKFDAYKNMTFFLKGSRGIAIEKLL